jgi:hypothetical protein
MSTSVATAILNVVFIRYCATRIKENTALFNIRRRTDWDTGQPCMEDEATRSKEKYDRQP